MKRMTRILAMAAVLALGVGLAAAQTTPGEPFDAACRNWDATGDGNLFACPTSGNTGSPPCNIAYRFYGPDAASGAVNAQVDGNPIYIASQGAGSYRSDLDNSSNYYGSPHSAGAEMIVAWDAELGLADGNPPGDHAGYYGATSQEIWPNETGDIYRGNCSGTRAVACFGATSGGRADPSNDTPQGSLPRRGCLAAVPCPVVTASNTNVDVTLSWPDARNSYFPAEFAGDGAGNVPRDPVVGVDIYLLTSSSPAVELDSRSVTTADLDGGAVLHGFFAKGTTTTVINFAADLPAGTTHFLPAAKVRYRDNGDGSPVSSQWSCNGPVVRTDAGLFTPVTNFVADYVGKDKGLHSAEISWQTEAEDGTIGFQLYRGTALEGPFTKIADIPAKGIGGEGAFYVQEDVFKVQGKYSQVFYRLDVLESDGGDNTNGPIRMPVAPDRPGMGLGRK